MPNHVASNSLQKSAMHNQHCWPCGEYYPKRHEQGEHCANGYKCCPERCSEYDYQAEASLEACKDTLITKDDSKTVEQPDLSALLCVVAEIEAWLVRELWDDGISDACKARIQKHAIDKLDKLRTDKA